jgi:hypothetical protein
MFTFNAHPSQSISEMNTRGIFKDLFRVIEAEHRAEYSETDAKKAEAREDVDFAITSLGWSVYMALLSDAYGATLDFRQHVADAKAKAAAPKATKQRGKRKTGKRVH